MKEAAKVSNDYTYFSQNKKTYEALDEEDPFIDEDDETPLRVGYEYKVWQLTNEKKICIRCKIDSYTQVGAKKENLNLYVLPEWNTKRQTWNKDLDMQTSVCLTREISDNATKFSRWTVQSLLSGVDKMRFGFVQRADSKGEVHKMVGSFSVETKSFAGQINLNMSNCWAVLKDVIGVVYDQEDKAGTYLYLKDP